MFEPVIAPADPADHPFAALAALKQSVSAAKPEIDRQIHQQNQGQMSPMAVAGAVVSATGHGIVPPDQ